jgi:hypothetical protein
MEFGNLLVMALLGFLVGGIVVYFSGKFLPKRREITHRDDAQFLLERIEKVFKVVLAEGYFTEIYDHDTKKAFWGIFKTRSKALIIAKAKVSVGYNFAKLHIHRDFENRKLIIDHFPPADVIAVDTDYKFYDLNQGLLNKFNNEDYTEILVEAKRLMQEKAMESDLPRIAEQQIKVMITQLCGASGWALELKESELRTLPIKDTSLITAAPNADNPSNIIDDDPSVNSYRK